MSDCGSRDTTSPAAGRRSDHDHDDDAPCRQQSCSSSKFTMARWIFRSRGSVHSERELRNTQSPPPANNNNNKVGEVVAWGEWCQQTLRQACSQGTPGSARCVQSFDDSLDSASRKTYRISLRSSSLWEPRHPSLKVLQR